MPLLILLLSLLLFYQFLKSYTAPFLTLLAIRTLASLTIGPRFCVLLPILAVAIYVNLPKPETTHLSAAFGRLSVPAHTHTCCYFFSLFFYRLPTKTHNMTDH